VVFRKARVAVFVDGCFWHNCPTHGTVPKANRSWWEAKLLANSERDRDTVNVLRGEGWHPLRVWEHEDPERASDRIEDLVRRRQKAEAGERCA
jgi:DNA mismatch endonuclease (patch repair protein)